MILAYEFLGASIDFLYRVIEEIVHRPVEKDLGDAVAAGGNDGGLAPYTDCGVKERIAGQHGLYIRLNAVDIRQSAGVHRSETHGRDRRHHRLHRQSQRRVPQHGQKQIGIVRKEVVRNRVGIVEQRTIRFAAGKGICSQLIQRGIAVSGAFRRGKAQNARH